MSNFGHFDRDMSQRHGLEEEEGTVVGDEPPLTREITSHSHLTADTEKDEHRSEMSPSRVREAAHRINDDLAMLNVERQVSRQVKEGDFLTVTEPAQKTRSRRTEPTDEFDIATQPLHQHASIYKPPANPTGSAAKLFKKIHESSAIIRYFTYIVPVVLILLIPVLLGALQFQTANVGGVKLLWFGVWLEVVWLTLWASRILAKFLPYPIGLICSLFSNNSKKWRDMCKQLELPATLFFWALAVEISFLPTMTNHHITGNHDHLEWEDSMNQVLICLLVAMVLNFVEKIIIQLIAISFHLRTYEDRIEVNQFQIGSLAKLYKYSKEKIQEDDSDFEEDHTSSGAQTPGHLVKQAQKTTKDAMAKVGDVAGKIAGDFTGKKIVDSEHPHQVVLTLLSSSEGSQVLARRLYRTFAREETQTVHSEDLTQAFDSEEEAEAAFTMFDKDMNGDISMEELEAVCVEIGRERKAIMASLKDLDSVVSKLDDVFMFIVLIISILVFVSILATSATAVLASAGSTLLALSWLFSITAQEFLQSIIFVFVKHPYDVGDRVTIYGFSGKTGMGDDYFVKEIALLYTEFKKMEGHVVQAPNSYLNTLFILNQRRSGALAEGIPVIIKYGTTIEQMDQLRQRLLDFVTDEKREYKTSILTELKEVTEAHQLTLNVVFFYKSNWQNELLRLQRRNKFICALMVAMQELEIEGPRMRYPGMKESFPVYLSNVPHVGTPGAGHGGHPDNNRGIHHDDPHGPVGPMGPPGPSSASVHPGSSASVRAPSTRARGESLVSASRRYDFSLGMRDLGLGAPSGDVLDERERVRVPINVTSPSPNRGSTERRRPSNEGPRRSNELAHSTSISDGRSESGMSRIRSSHRNRFFGTRARGVSDVESAMADIPEDPNGSGEGSSRIDPRTGMVSNRAYRLSEDSQRMSEDPIRIHPPTRSHTTGEDVEMKRL